MCHPARVRTRKRKEKRTMSDNAVKYYEIDEKTAKLAKAMNSFSDYVPGSATKEYREMVDSAAALAEKKKQAVDPMYHDKIDHLLDKYARKLAENLNQHYSIETRVPSIMISGAGNFPTAKKHKQNAARDRNMEEYQGIKGILSQIESVGRGGISADDPHALDKLKAKLATMEENHAEMKAANAHWRKHGTMAGYNGMTAEQAAARDEEIKSDYSWCRQPHSSVTLQNNNANIKRIKERIERMERREAAGGFVGWEFDGGHVVANAEANRLQIYFDQIPSAQQRQDMKSQGFRYSKANNHAWQRQLTGNAIYAAECLGFVNPKDGRTPRQIQPKLPPKEKVQAAPER